MRLHHIGVVVKDISQSIKTYEKILGLDIIAEPEEDPIQKVKAVFLDMGWGEGITLELLEPTAQDSPVMKSLGRGGGLHHICFEVDDIDEEIKRVKEKGGTVVCEPVPACGFDNRRIAFVFPVDNILVEFVEREKAK
ncbi:MAG TPA: VOC family protein [Desulfobacteraceae bacterium]|nr:VOC family protein [Desulfobacteraceae bacterium]HPQ29927.1 VOC family protein [Desulfobacteraceae bacterium]